MEFNKRLLYSRCKQATLSVIPCCSGMLKPGQKRGENPVLQVCLRHSLNCAQVRCETFFLSVVIPPPPFLRLLSMPCCKPLFLFLFSVRVPRGVRKIVLRALYRVFLQDQCPSEECQMQPCFPFFVDHGIVSRSPTGNTILIGAQQ